MRSSRDIAESTATTNHLDDPYSDNEGELMKATPSKAKKKSDVVAFSDARKAVIDRMVATTRVVKVPSSLGLRKPSE
jgi:hypothetical protein